MQIDFSTASLKDVSSDWLIVGLSFVSSEGSGAKVSSLESQLDEVTGGAIGRLRSRGDFKGKLAELMPLYDLPGLKASRVLLVGLGTLTELILPKLQRACAASLRKVAEQASVSVAVALPEGELAGKSKADIIETLTSAAVVAGVSQGMYKQEATRYPIKQLTVLSATSDQLTQAATHGQIIGESINIVRELVNRGPHDIYPATFADRASQLAAEYGISCEVFDEKRLADEKMFSMLGVARGSTQPARMVMLEYKGGNPDQPHIALVGKGVTFDSGGYSLKPTDGMLTMKCDMAGAATALGAIIAAARMNLPVNVRAYLGLVENMVSGNAYKLGEVLTARNGVTIEVCNTDAEGRLVLADVLCYAVDQGAESLVDLATLTGACVIALGEDYVGLFSNNDDLAMHIQTAASEAGELVWRMPMDDSFNDQLKADVADCKNVGTRWGGAITAAKFLEKFVSGKPWAHLDIAGPAYITTGKAYREGGATGVMVKTLVELLAK